MVSNGFPDGAPADACVRRERVNQPNHGAARSQKLETLPYIVVASQSHYNPGQKVTVQIYPAHNPNQIFRGFFLQARDAETNEWIGHWDQLLNIKTIPECSAVTHADPKNKTGATLVWNAPHHKSGQVYFTGTVLQDYGTFWGDIVARYAAPEPHHL
ncbi:putative defense protein 3 [Condylostylus longicornis]|uniref:putative defense protein 3 n=1 Tax=Condylostylus longicornis TaxID=2530218 RepID=UPI00244E5070|nr:putative defense protein 3 [Condylostylus longicornis]